MVTSTFGAPRLMFRFADFPILIVEWTNSRSTYRVVEESPSSVVEEEGIGGEV